MRARWQGRREELAQIQDALTSPGVVFVHGLGGIGKTGLLREVRERHPGPSHWIDASALPSRLADLVELTRSGVLFIDGLDLLHSLAGQLRTALLPLLDSDARLVLSSRARPGLRWVSDLPVGSFLSIELHGLEREDAQALLQNRGVKETKTEALLDLCEGHPLMLTLAAHLPGTPDDLDPALEVVTAMVQAMDLVPQAPLLRQAVRVAAIARRTHEPMLRKILDLEDATEVFDALAAQSWIQQDQDGLHPHDLVRKAQRAHTKWRDRAGYDELAMKVAGHVAQEVRTQGPHALQDLLFLLADNPVYRRMTAHREGTRPGPIEVVLDPGTIRTHLVPHYGRLHGERLEALHARDRLTLYGMRDTEGDLTELMPVLDDSLFDWDTPREDAVMEAVRQLGRPFVQRQGDRLLLGLGAAHREHGLTEPLSNARILAAGCHLALQLPNLRGFGAIVTPASFWLQMHAHTQSTMHIREVPSEGHLVQIQDLRIRDLAGWLAGQLYPPSGHPPEVEVLDEEEFAHAVREGLKQMSNPKELAKSRLARTPLALTSHLRHTSLRNILHGAIEDLSNRRQREVLHQTFVEPAHKQFAAAAALDLTFSTYRRALERGVRGVTEALWRLELDLPQH